ncbi:MAG: ATP-dependent DNA helicase [Coleofasciculus sp. G3-WIS-01]|uniref:ATP-dependent DNA helicase n=1 Tax=Coleofasciculus sp. G3-WIS-01 TaxID=3069528 RepID=UPI0032FF52DA
MIEVEVHSSLRAFLREQGQPNWPHHLTMARLVARALRLGRSALIQTGSTQGLYRLSYLAPALIWQEPVIIVAPVSVQKWLLQVEIPSLQEWMGTNKAIYVGDTFPDEDFQGLLITTPEAWLADRLAQKREFPPGIPTLIDQADDLEDWVRDQLKSTIEPQHWHELMLAHPQKTAWIRDMRVRLTKLLFEHPANPYDCYLIESGEQAVLQELFEVLQSENGGESFYLPTAWKQFWQCWQSSNQFTWAAIERSQGQFSLYCEPKEVATSLSPIWLEQPVVLIGGALDLEASAAVYRQQLGLGELTCLKFSPDRHSKLIQLYLPDGLPMPNTPRFQHALFQQVRTLLGATHQVKTPIVILVGDVPLKSQLGAVLAAEFGSRVQVEKTQLDEKGILVCGWEFWRSQQQILPSPQLLIIATLPLPSLESPWVAGKVAHYKQRRLDWFRLFLLPAALRELQRAVAPVRDSQGIVALLDNRVNYRSYGTQVLSALSPFAQINYVDDGWFE